LVVLIRFAYLAVTNAFTVLRLLPRSDRDKDIEILALRHQLNVLQRHLDGQQVRFAPAERAFLTALLTTLSKPTTTPTGHTELSRKPPLD
jgi:putative transposase